METIDSIFGNFNQFLEEYNDNIFSLEKIDDIYAHLDEDEIKATVDFCLSIGSNILLKVTRSTLK